MCKCMLVLCLCWLILCLLLTRYAAEVDVDFVRKSVRAIGRCAIKVESASERCVSTLVELIQTKVQHPDSLHCKSCISTHIRFSYWWHAYYRYILGWFIKSFLIMMQKKFLLCIFCILWYLYIDCSYILVSTVLLVPVNWNIYIYCYTQVTYVVSRSRGGDQRHLQKIP